MPRTGGRKEQPRALETTANKKKGYGNLIGTNLFPISDASSTLPAPTSAIHFFSHIERTNMCFSCMGHGIKK